MADNSNSAGKGRQKRTAKDGRSLIGPDGKHIPSQQAGRKGGRPRTVPRVVAPPEKAIPASVPFPVSPERWQLFCEVFASGGGKMEPACDRIGVPRTTVRDWFAWAADGKEPWRTEVAKAMASLSDMAAKVGHHAAKRDPWAWLHTAYPEVYPHPRQVIDVSSGGLSIDDLLRRALELQAESEPAGDDD